MVDNKTMTFLFPIKLADNKITMSEILIKIIEYKNTMY
jgi:hypothetical protein